MKTLLFSSLLLTLAITNVAHAAQFRIGLMQDEAGAAAKFKPLIDYLNKKGMEATFVTAKDYPNAASMFANGEVDAMFSGSGIAGSMIIKDLAAPVVRPVGKDGNSTYWAVVIGKKGSPKFDGKADYFADKKVMFTSLASSGEFFYRSICGGAGKATIHKAASHGSAIQAVNAGLADIAIVKNRVWDKSKDQHPDLELLGEDKGQNPDGTLIVSRKLDSGAVKKIAELLLGIKSDSSAEATAARESLGIQGYVATTTKDFEHNLKLLKSAGVTPNFNFQF